MMDPREWLAGAAVGGFSVMICQSLGALIFAGKIPEAVPLGTASALVAALVTGLVVAWRTSCPGVIASSQERIAPNGSLIPTWPFTPAGSAFSSNAGFSNRAIPSASPR